MSQTNEPILKLNRQTSTLELTGFHNIDPNGIVTFTLHPRGVMIFAGVLTAPFEFCTTLTDGKCHDAKIFHLVDKWLEDSPKDSAYFIEVGKHYIEVRNSYDYQED